MTSPVWDRPEVALIRHMGGRIYARVGAHKWTELPTWGHVLVTEDLVARQHQALAVFVSRGDDERWNTPDEVIANQAALIAHLRAEAAEAQADLIDHLIDRFYAGDKNHFALPPSTIAWLRNQPAYLARYPREATE